MSDRNLWQRINAIKAECAAIPKDGHNKHHGFAFVSHDGLLDFLRQKMHQHGVTVAYLGVSKVEHVDAGTTRSGAAKIRFLVTVRYLVVNANNPEERFEAVGYGEAIDQEDKGHSKAITSAHKYFLMKLFDVSGGEEEPDATGGDRVEQSAPPRRHETRPAQAAAPQPGLPAPSGEPIGTKAAMSLLDHLRERAMTLRDIREALAQKGASREILLKYPFHPEHWPVEYKDHIKSVLADRKPVPEPTQRTEERAVWLVTREWDKALRNRIETRTLPQSGPKSPQEVVDLLKRTRPSIEDVISLLEEGSVMLPEGDIIPF